MVTSTITFSQRAGTRLGQSEHYRFLADQTVFKGTARYDGMPVIAEAFVAIGIKGTSVSADAVSFAEDTANPNAGRQARRPYNQRSNTLCNI